MVERIAGTNRCLTSYEIVKAFDSEFGSDVMLATGASFPDALAGGVLAAKLKTPLLLTAPSGLIDEMKDYIISKKPANIYILGGQFSVPDSVIEGIF